MPCEYRQLSAWRRDSFAETMSWEHGLYVLERQGRVPAEQGLGGSGIAGDYIGLAGFSARKAC